MLDLFRRRIFGEQSTQRFLPARGKLCYHVIVRQQLLHHRTRLRHIVRLLTSRVVIRWYARRVVSGKRWRKV